jgi:hypothetical protein
MHFGLGCSCFVLLCPLELLQVCQEILRTLFIEATYEKERALEVFGGIKPSRKKSGQGSRGHCFGCCA